MSAPGTAALSTGDTLLGHRLSLRMTSTSPRWSATVVAPATTTPADCRSRSRAKVATSDCGSVPGAALLVVLGAGAAITTARLAVCGVSPDTVSSLPAEYADTTFAAALRDTDCA